MQHYKLKISMFLLLVLGHTWIQAQTIYIKQSNGTQTAYALNEIQKISFSDGELNISKSDNSISAYALGELQHLKFDTITIDVNELVVVQSRKIQVYPNPASDVLYIKFSPTDYPEGTIDLMSFEGKIVMSRQVRNAVVHSLDIGHLREGIYLICYRNVTVTKTIKIIKK